MKLNNIDRSHGGFIQLAQAAKLCKLPLFAVSKKVTGIRFWAA